MLVNFVFSDWRNNKEESVYSTEKGVKLSLGSFHSGTAFVGDMYLSHDDQQDLRQALAEGYHPVFAIHGEAITVYQVQNIKQLIKRLRDPNTMIPTEMQDELKAGNVSVLADVLECALEVK
jgi:hypothetical protein